jgi:hypothetical protein
MRLKKGQKGIENTNNRKQITKWQNEVLPVSNNLECKQIKFCNQNI